MQLLSEVLDAVDDLDADGRKAGEREDARQRHTLRASNLLGTCHNVDGDLGELPSGQTGFNRKASARPARCIGAQRSPRSERELEPIAVWIAPKCLGEHGSQSIGARRVVPGREVEIPGRPRSVAPADLERHAALQHPTATLCIVEPDQKPFEDDPPPESVQIDAGLSGAGDETSLQGHPKRGRGRVVHSSPPSRSARSIRRAARGPSSSERDIRAPLVVGVCSQVRCTASTSRSRSSVPAAASSSVRSGVVIPNPSYSQTSPGGSSARWSRMPAGARERKLVGTVRWTTAGFGVAEVVHGERRLVRHDRSVPAPERPPHEVVVLADRPLRQSEKPAVHSRQLPRSDVELLGRVGVADRQSLGGREMAGLLCRQSG